MVMHELNKRLYEYFGYKPHSTKVDSPIDVALESRQGVCQDFAHIMITLIRTGQPAAGSLTLVFGTGPLELRQWKVLDAQGRQTQVSLYDVAPAGPFPDSLFQYNNGASPIQSGG